MKKIVCIALLLVCIMSNCLAAEWAEGRSPAKPYLQSAPVDFEKDIGYLMFFPNSKDTARLSEDTLSIYTPREDLSVGAGKMYISTEEDGLLYEIEVSADTLAARVMTEEELEALLWGSGMVFELKMPQVLEIKKHYYVQFDAYILKDEARGIGNQVAGGKNWSFDTVLGYEIGEAVYSRLDENGEPVVIKAEEGVCVGDTASVDVKLDGTAASAIVYAAEGLIDIETAKLTEDGTVNVTFLMAGETTWCVSFLDEYDDTLDTVTFVTNVEESEE